MVAALEMKYARKAEPEPEPETRATPPHRSRPPAMGAFDDIIQILLFVCFGVYIVMSLTLTIMGLVYMNDVGAVGATGSYLIFFGLMMLSISGIAIFANLKQSWLILFVVEIVNIFLFLGLYVVIIIVVMMASGSSDPIRRASTSAWDDIRPQLTVKESDGAGGRYCETMVEGGGCKAWYDKMSKMETNAEGCLIGNTAGGGIAIEAALNNCTQVSDWDACKPLQGDCDACDSACMEQSIQDIKDEIIPASYFVLFLTVYFIVVIIWNNIMIGNDDLEALRGTARDLASLSALRVCRHYAPVERSKIIGLILNGILLLFALILVIMGLVGYFSIECPNDTDCVPTSLVMMILMGLSTLVVSGAAVAGIQHNNVLLRIGTIVMCFVVIFLIMTGIVMGMSSGAIMDDMNYYYDTQYPKLRSALEQIHSSDCPGQRQDNCYCQMTAAACTALTLDGTTTFPTDKEKVKVEGSTAITKAAMWKMQWNAASSLAHRVPEHRRPTWLTVCQSTGITSEGCGCVDRFDKSKDSKCKQKAADNIKFMVDDSYKKHSNYEEERYRTFCNYPDKQCKQKIQDSVESSMSTIAVFGVIFCLFFLGIIFFTLQAIHIYREATLWRIDDDDDDDGDDDE
eukprot:SAG22_NODE_761_length_7410_cov_16.687868_2_plen_627_part_00